MRSGWRFPGAAVVVVSGLVALTGASPAMAQGKPPAKAGAGKVPAKGPAKPLTDKQKKDGAKKNYKAGEKLFKDGKFKEAFEAYKAADDLIPIAATKYKMAVCLDKQSQIIESAAAYQVFLDSSPAPEKFADAIADSKARLDVLKKTPGKVKLAIEPDGLPKLGLQVDAGPVYGPPKDKTLTIPPGHHKITATAEGRDPAVAEFDLGFAQTVDLKLALPPAAPPPPPPPPPPIAVAPPPPPPPPAAPPSRVPAYVTLGLAGAGAVVGTIFGVQALGAKSDFKAHPTTANADKTDRNALVSDMSFAVALTFGVTSTILFITHGRGHEAPAENAPPKTGPHAFVAPFVGPGGGGAGALVTF